jgi:hypothetical protein
MPAFIVHGSVAEPGRLAKPQSSALSHRPKSLLGEGTTGTNPTLGTVTACAGVHRPGIPSSVAAGPLHGYASAHNDRLEDLLRRFPVL